MVAASAFKVGVEAGAHEIAGSVASMDSNDAISDIGDSDWNDTDTASTECTVCFESLRPIDAAVCLPRCSHVFHAGCLSLWLEAGNRTCPNCRCDADPGCVMDRIPLLEETLARLTGGVLLSRVTNEGSELERLDVESACSEPASISTEHGWPRLARSEIPCEQTEATGMNYCNALLRAAQTPLRRATSTEGRTCPNIRCSSPLEPKSLVPVRRLSAGGVQLVNGRILLCTSRQRLQLGKCNTNRLRLPMINDDDELETEDNIYARQMGQDAVDPEMEYD